MTHPRSIPGEDGDETVKDEDPEQHEEKSTAFGEVEFRLHWENNYSSTDTLQSMKKRLVWPSQL